MAVADELRRLIRRTATIFRQRAQASRRARFWSEVHEGEREAATNAADPVDPRFEQTLRHRRRSREV